MNFEVGDLVYWYPEMSLTPYIIMKIYPKFNTEINKQETFVDLLSLTQDPNTNPGVRWVRQIFLDKNNPKIFKVLEYNKKANNNEN